MAKVAKNVPRRELNLWLKLRNDFICQREFKYPKRYLWSAILLKGSPKKWLFGKTNASISPIFFYCGLKQHKMSTDKSHFFWQLNVREKKVLFQGEVEQGWGGNVLSADGTKNLKTQAFKKINQPEQFMDPQECLILILSLCQQFTSNHDIGYFVPWFE